MSDEEEGPIRTRLREWRERRKRRKERIEIVQAVPAGKEPPTPQPKKQKNK